MTLALVVQLPYRCLVETCRRPVVDLLVMDLPQV